MKVLVIGRGWVGNKVFQELLNRGHYAVIQSHKEDIVHKYDYIVNCAGYTGTPNVDACEKNKKITIDANSCFPIVLYEKCKLLNIPLAHFSSGCIYSGSIGSVHDDPNYFGSIYSISKGISDTYLKDKCLVLRIRMPFTQYDEPKNLLTKLIKYAKTGKLYDGGQNSLTDLDEAVAVACDLIENKQMGPFNLVNSGSVSNKEIAKMLGLQSAWFDDQEFKAITVAQRSNCIIPCNTNMRDIKIALADRIYHLLNKI